MKFYSVTTALLLALAPAGARAQLLERYLPQSVGPYEANPTLAILQQGGADYHASGLRVDDFIIHPELSETAGYAQNPLGLVQGGRSSGVFDTSASVSVQSDFSRNALAASVSIDNSSYPSESVADATSSTAFVGGTIDVGRNQIALGAGHVSGNLSSTDVLDFGQAAPVPYQSNDLRASYTQNFGKLRIAPAIDLTSFRFGRVAVGNHAVDDTGLDKNQIEGSLVGHYELSGGHDLVAVLRETSGQLLHAGGVGSYLASAALAGIDYVAGGLFRYDVLLGFEHRQFQGAIPAIDTPLAEAAVMYTPTRLTTVTAQLSREIADPTYNVTNDLTSTSGRLTVDQAYLRNVIWQGRAGFDLGQSNGVAGSRRDLTAGAGVTWFFSRRVSLAASYDFVRADGSGAGTFAGLGNGAANLGNSQLSYSTAVVSVHWQL